MGNHCELSSHHARILRGGRLGGWALALDNTVFAYHLYLQAHALIKQSLRYPQKCLITVADHWVPGIVVGAIATIHVL